MYNLSSKFLVRIPLLAYNQFNGVYIDIKKYIMAPLIQEAIYLASPVLYKEMMKYLSGKITDSKEIERIINSCTRYLSRMSTRCTPFGLFASL